MNERKVEKFRETLIKQYEYLRDTKQTERSLATIKCLQIFNHIYHGVELPLDSQ